MYSKPPTYAPLFVRSNYSFLTGASHPEELVATAASLGLPALALTDRDGLYGVVRAHEEARQHSTRVIVGSQITVDHPLHGDSTLLLLATTLEGYRNLSALITTGRLRCEKGTSRVTWTEVADHAGDLIALWGGSTSLLLHDDRPDPTAHLLKEAFQDRLYALLTRHLTEDEDRREPLFWTRVERYGLPPVAAVETLYHHPRRRRLQDVLTCIRHGVCLDDASPHLLPNAEHALLPPDAFAHRFQDRPDAIERTLEIAHRCAYSMDDLTYRYPIGDLPSGYDADAWLRELSLRGARNRYGSPLPTAVEDQLVREFAIIADLDVAGYFLTMRDIVDYCDAHDILCQGRGSAANSIVCYCLGITAVDPVGLGLLFERFVSRERAEPPDIDLDIAHQRREEVIQHVYDHYGRHRAAMVANVIRYRPRSAVRDVGKTLGLTEATADRLARLLSHRSHLTEDLWEQAGLDPTTHRHRLLEELTNELLDFPRHLGIHPGGFLLAEESVSHVVPVENATMEGRTVIQWDKYDVEAMGLFKVDLLGLGALTMLDQAFRLLREHRHIDLDMASLPQDDKPTYDMICDADTLGTFQIESRAQMSMLPRLRPREYYDLVIQISLIRPGPITGNMVHPYLRRRRGEEEIDYPHPALIPVLEKTLGIPLFQEQVMRLAIVAADYTPGEADQLRRDMAAWRKSGRLERHRDKLVSRMIAHGIEEEFAERIFQQIRGFADYGFPESHAASFALIAYATAYLRCHAPVVFSCALLNSQPMGFYSPATVVEDARRRGIDVRPIDVRHSHRDCTLEPLDPGHRDPTKAFALRMGLRYVKGLRDQSIDDLLTARDHRPFQDLPDLLARTRLPRNDRDRLAECGALEGFGLSRRQALWHIAGQKALEDAPITLAIRDDEEHLTPAFEELQHLETIRWDYRTSFHSPRGHPLEPLRPVLRRMNLPTAEELWDLPDGTRTHFAALVICRQRPATASGVVFMTLEDETGLANIVIFPHVFDRFPVITRTESFLGITGKIQNHEGVTHLLAEHLWVPRHDAPTTPSRDFH